MEGPAWGRLGLSKTGGRTNASKKRMRKRNTQRSVATDSQARREDEQVDDEMEQETRRGKQE